MGVPSDLTVSSFHHGHASGPRDSRSNVKLTR
jgi:hypothetical protein